MAEDRAHRLGFHRLSSLLHRSKSKSPQPPNPREADRESSAPQSQLKEQIKLAQDGQFSIDTTVNDNMHRREKPEPPRISLLWHETYVELKKVEPELMIQYEKEAARSVGLQILPADKDQFLLQMGKVVQKKQEEIEEKKWKGKFKNHEFAVKDFVEPAVSIVQWSRDYIGDAINTASYPPASIAWAGLCLALPLVLNPFDQEAIRTNAMEQIAVMIWQCALREQTCDMRYANTESNQEFSVISSFQIEYRSTMKDLYMQILTFEAKVVHFFSGNTSKRILQESVKWNDWGVWMGDILKKKEVLEKLEIEYEKVYGEEKWKQQWRRKEAQHKETLGRIDAVKGAIEEFRADVAKAQKLSDRKELIEWLKEPTKNLEKMKRPQPSPQDSMFSDWLFRESNYRAWKTEDNSFLWLRGKAGCGKSILNSNVVRDLDHEFSSDPFTAVTYFFISFKIKTTLDPSILLRTLIAQLLAGRPDLPKPLQVLQKRKDSDESPTQEELIDALRAVASGFKRTYIIIDGLDECPNSQDAGAFRADIEGEPREDLLKILGVIRKWNSKGIHLCVGSRPNKDIVDALHDLLKKPASTLINLQEREYQNFILDDIDRYVGEELDGIHQFADKSNLKKEIRRSLRKKSGGMFLYVKLQLQLIKLSPVNEEKTLTILRELPPGLYETYDQIFSRIDEKLRKHAIRVLTWTSVAPTPIHVEDFTEAPLVNFRSLDVMDASPEIDVDLSTPLFKETEKYCDAEEVLNFLPGLLVNEEGCITLVHYSLSEYLVSEEIKSKDDIIQEFALNLTTARLQVADTCLRLFVQRKEVASTLRNWEETRSHSTYAILLLGIEILELVKLRNWPSSWGTLIKRAFFDTNAIPDASLDDQAVVNVDDRADIKLPRENFFPLYFDPMPLSLVLGNGYFELLVYFVQQGLVNLKDPVTSPLWGFKLTALYFTCSPERCKNVSKMFKVLLSCGCDYFEPCGDFNNVFNYCIRMGSPSIYNLSQDPHALERCMEEGYSPLIDAITVPEGIGLILQTLSSAFPHALEIFDRPSMPALHTAVAIGSIRRTGWLLRNGADLHVRDEFFGNALQLAVATMRLVLIEELLSQGACMDPEGTDWDNTLHAVAEGRILNEGAEGGALAVARLTLAQTIFGDQDYSEDCVRRFFNAAQSPDIWSGSVSVQWKHLRAWDGQEISPEFTEVGTGEQLRRADFLGIEIVQGDFYFDR